VYNYYKLFVQNLNFFIKKTNNKNKKKLIFLTRIQPFFVHSGSQDGLGFEREDTSTVFLHREGQKTYFVVAKNSAVNSPIASFNKA
jgi:hypothetical protein